jgi:glycosyltransferase involved in cell wall biosynthesis
LSKKINIHVIFLALTDQVVISEKFRSEIKFPYHIISNKQIEKRNIIISMIKVVGLLNKLKFKKIIFGGYDNLETLLLPFFLSKNKNCLQFESSIFESKSTGPIAWVKKIILSRHRAVLPSGEMQCQLLRKLSFSGVIIKTSGVGIFNRIPFDKIEKSNFEGNFKYLYVGRLIQKKNLFMLIKIFNENKKPLLIVGDGILSKELRSNANSNITFASFVDNNQISNIYLNNDIFILPSEAEPWGLVVEESVYYHLPVIISSNVGCQNEIVANPQTGLIFESSNEQSLKESIDLIELKFNKYRNNCCSFNFESRDNKQIQAYIDLANL